MLVNNNVYNKQNKTSFNGIGSSIKSVMAPINERVIEPAFVKYVDTFAKSEFVQKKVENANMKFMQRFVPPFISLWMSSWYIAFTLKNPKIEEERKKPLAINMAFVALFCTAVQGTFTKNSSKLKQVILESSITRNIKNKTQQSIMRFIQIINDKENSKVGKLLKVLADKPEVFETFKHLNTEFTQNNQALNSRYKKLFSKISPDTMEVLSKEEADKFANAIDLVKEHLKTNPSATVEQLESVVNVAEIQPIAKKLASQLDMGSVITRLDHGKYPILTDHISHFKVLKELGCINPDGVTLKADSEIKAAICSLTKEQIQAMKSKLNLDKEMTRRLSLASGNASKNELIEELKNDIQKNYDFRIPIPKDATLLDVEKVMSKREKAVSSYEARSTLKNGISKLDSPITMSSEDIEEMNKMLKDKTNRSKMIEFFNLSTDRSQIEAGKKQDLHKFVEVADTIFSIDYFIPIVSNMMVFRILGPVLATPAAAGITNYVLDKKKEREQAAAKLIEKHNVK